MQALVLEGGALRVTPASSYNDPSLSPAVADDELSCDLATHVFDEDITLIDPCRARLADVFGEPENAPCTVTARTNYYVWCASFELRLRMFEDFQADAALVIHDPGEFTRRARPAMSSHASTSGISTSRISGMSFFHRRP